MLDEGDKGSEGRDGVLDNRVTWWWSVENLAGLQVRGTSARRRGGSMPVAACRRAAWRETLSLVPRGWWRGGGAGGAMLDALHHRAMTYGGLSTG